jgi:hypothetical protein
MYHIKYHFILSKNLSNVFSPATKTPNSLKLSTTPDLTRCGLVYIESNHNSTDTIPTAVDKVEIVK